ncbi:ATP-binding cassette domain-containing protein, partial [Streptococcus thermophilus]
MSLTFNKGKSNEVEAIDDVSFDIYEGEIFGLVGESGSGKTTIGRSVLKLSDIDSGTESSIMKLATSPCLKIFVLLSFS